MASPTSKKKQRVSSYEEYLERYAPRESSSRNDDDNAEAKILARETLHIFEKALK